MLDLRKLLEDLPPIPKKKHHVTIQGKTVEVSLEKSIEVRKHGEDAYMWKGDQFVLKPKTSIKTTWRVLKKDERGYDFLDGDIHWPTGIIEGGYTWQRKSE